MKRFKVPDSYDAPVGPVTVVWKEKIVDGETSNDVCYGRWSWERREIEMLRGMGDYAAAYTFFHERTHQELDDAGPAQAMPDLQKELVCDAIALARVAELRRNGQLR